MVGRRPFGLMGLGKVGREVLLRASAGGGGASLMWAADSRRILVKRDRTPFSSRDLRCIAALKGEPGADFGAECERLVPGCVSLPFASPREELSTIREVSADGERDDWAVLDATSGTADAGYQVARGLMGVGVYCSANKAPWADYDLCSELYSAAKREGTFLALNCTTGVWVDQMEFLPLTVRGLVEGRVDVTKRDNSSFNLFFDMIGRMPASEALAEIAARGHLEPGADGLRVEIRDQARKASVAANVCGIIRGVRPTFLDVVPGGGRGGPESADLGDIADWHLRGRGRGVYPALVTRIGVETGRGGRVDCELAFRELPTGHPLAVDLPGKNAMMIRSSPRTKFAWSRRPKRGWFMSAGYGGAVKTAAKMLSESERCALLSKLRGEADHEPIPVLFGLSVGDTLAKRFRERVARVV